MTSEIANTDMAAAWDGEEGAGWARDWERYDLAVDRHHRRFIEGARISRGDRVLDVGCGNGRSTRDAGRAASEGSVLGVDLSGPMLSRARELTGAEGLTNVTFEQADAQVHQFEAGAFDLAMSRFGAMFFADPIAGFTNIGRALRPGGRLVLLTWQPLDQNEWLQVVFRSLAAGRDLAGPPVGAPGPFGLADPDQVRPILAAAGYEDIAFEAVAEKFWSGSDAADAFAFVETSGPVRGLLQGLDASDAEHGLALLRDEMAAREAAEGVLFDSGTWLVTARRPA